MSYDLTLTRRAGRHRRHPVKNSLLRLLNRRRYPEPIIWTRRTLLQQVCEEIGRVELRKGSDLRLYRLESLRRELAALPDNQWDDNLPRRWTELRDRSC